MGLRMLRLLKIFCNKKVISNIFLLLFFCFLFESKLINDAISAPAPEKIENIDQLDVSNTNYRSLATSPSCLLDIVGLVTLLSGFVGGIIEVAGGVASINSGIALLALPDPTTISKIKGTALKVSGWASVGVGIGAIVYSVLGGAGFGQCMHSFVKDPVEYYPDVMPSDHPDFDNRGKMQMVLKDSNGRFKGFRPVEGYRYKNKIGGHDVDIECKNENDCYFIGRPSASADKITVCARGSFPNAIMPFAGWFEGCYGDTSWYGGGFSYDVISKYPYYNGPTSMLCPEEYRQVGRMPNLDTTDSNGYMKLKCTAKDPNDCPKSMMSPLFRGSGDPERFKLYFGRPTCKTGEAGQTVQIGGYNYKIIEKAGVQLCARLTGLIGGLPWVQSYEIGCIKKLNMNLIPKCPASVPVYEDLEFDKDTGIIINNGGKNPKARIIRYDDSPCYNKCSVSQLCTTSVRGLFQAPIPITSYLMACMKDSIGNIVYGCNNLSISTNNNNTGHAKNSGMLYAMQKRMRGIVLLLIMLSVILFGMQLLFFDSPPKKSEVMAFILKIAFVIYLTVDHGRENGMTVYSQWVESISTELQAIVLNSKNKTSVTGGKLCDYNDIDYIKNFPGENGTVIKRDFSYLRVWDNLDCHFAYYLSNGLVNPLVSGYKSVVFDQNIFHRVVSIIGLPIRFIFLILGSVLFAIFLLFVIIQVVELMILATMGFYILVMLSPIFVPFLLFKSTKQIFDAWVGQLIVYSLYPVILFAFMGFMFLVVDNIAFGQTIFTKSTGYVLGEKVRVFDVDTSKDFSAKCKNLGFNNSKNPVEPEEGDMVPGCDCDSVMCMMNSYVVKTKSSDSIFGPSVGAEIKANEAGTRKFQIGILGMMFAMLIFYQFAKVMPQIVQALSGSTRALMSAGRRVRSASSRMEGLGGITAGAFTSTERKDGDKNKNGKAPRTSASTK